MEQEGSQRNPELVSCLEQDILSLLHKQNLSLDSECLN